MPHVSSLFTFSRPRFLLTLTTLLGCLGAQGQAFTPVEIARWQQQAKQVTIVRDNWGVPHVTGKTDADAVFGLLYAQCEDDFARVEDNYIVNIGRLAEVEGEAAIYQDLRARLFLDSTQAISIYQKSPAWMKQLLNAFADGTNFYLYSHPTVKPRLLRRFQPWMPLMFSEGSIGGNISVVPLERLKNFYSQRKSTSWVRPDFERPDREPVGSNGFAIAPAKSASGHALLLINPHTSFYFRPEVQMTSATGLNAYGAVTWGQFFVYQGFNEHCGWMHTSSFADSMDEYLETVEPQKDGTLMYRYGGKLRPVQTAKMSIAYKQADGTIARKEFTTYRTHHGPVVGQQAENKWVTVRMMDTPLEALEQSYLRTKATDYASFQKVMQLNGNASNNTVFADSKGTIAYWHGNFMPRRDPQFDWSMPVDGSNPKTDWKGLHKVEEIVQVKNPASGWIQNCNSTPFTVSGPSSPKREQFPAYMAPDAENYRGVNAVRVLSRKTTFTLDTLIAAAKDPYLAGFEELIPALAKDFQFVLDSSNPPEGEILEAMKLLRGWDKRYSKTSVAQTLAIYWGERIQKLARTRVTPDMRLDNLSFTAFVIAKTTPTEKVTALQETLDELTKDFGTWKMPWGEVNRFQRLTGKIQETYDDKQPSLPVAFTSSAWGSLAAFGARTAPNTKKRYGYVGNSFIAVVEFGPRVKARSVLAGGNSNQPTSAHFTDQAGLYVEENFKDVLFYPEDIRQHAERTYSPGQ
ncbi:penicillin acylase family protein [Hymenobacter cellulosivorans]|uniref:Penicillin acylase family protein n=1 Tax=Hymenobacter cellulosivorans TaxID=2932249 RepID=A0ABY4FEV5_9BACT|nr:penicillin acylase family protein [Hymenobacter cellulosivorans]UOQ55210.1 penicillin acylase family protein [Hymenobacter cellulosivorans]